MKKTATAMLTLVAGIVAASCQKEAEPDIKSFEPMTINAVSEGIGTATKTEMAYKYDILWSEDDQIYVTDGTSNDTFTLSAGKGTTKGTFKQDGTASFTNDVQAYYPANMVQDGDLVWPAVQSNNQTVPMYCSKTVSGKVEDFNFSSLGAVLQIVFTTPRDNVTLESITLKDDEKPLSGTFTVDKNGKANITATDKAGITINLGEGVEVGNKIKYFNIALPAGTYNGLTITFTTTDHTFYTMRGSVTLSHNTVGRLSLTGKNAKKIGQGTATRTGNIEVNWVQLWDNGPKFAEYNVGAASASECGGYYCWGKTIDKDPDQYYDHGSDVLKGTYDTATNLWGDNWRMPTMEELQYLVDNCCVEWVNVNGVKGCKFTGKEGSSCENNSMFLPSAGRYDKDDGVVYLGSQGYYWSSTPVLNPVSRAYGLRTYSSSLGIEDIRRFYGYSVRAVLAE